ncbi:MAG: hypothetical protein A2513_02990 [Sulfurimonas sp. RIFOXYD12_FULL_33_39]|nr:MAG: hypothetical protein A3G74_08320 [Sulfurimonas sp. RIFCSPLOWO2_12_FULL_34_6]OHE09042.1 MAG: hypothetical protein A2513_02990 [Sulfurimonas sp. RIFOXYD12_FULL_33_39]OHE14354.1 MAG: hypothetical protein A2530_06290 [Sulfurimonas sp. RIFOXYD2_FULL_34_21]
MYLANKTTFLGNEEKSEIEKIIKTKLQESGFIFGEVDPITLVVKISSKEVHDTQVVNIELRLSEEVTTHRKGNIKTYAVTYFKSELIETSSPYEDTIEIINAMLDKFINAHKDDNQ